MGVSPWDLAGIPGPAHWIWGHYAQLVWNADADAQPTNDALSSFLTGRPTAM